MTKKLIFNTKKMKINTKKNGFIIKSNAETVREIIKAQYWMLKMDKLKATIENKSPLTLVEFLNNKY